MILALAVGSGGTWLALRHRAQTQQAQAAKYLLYISSILSLHVPKNK